MKFSNIVIQGKYVRMEEIQPKFFPYIVSWRNDKTVNPYIVQPFVLTEELEQQWYDKYVKEEGHCMFVLIDKCKGIPFGTLGYIYNFDEHYCIGTHMLIGDENYKFSECYLEAYLLLTDFIIENYDLESVYSHTVEGNVTAQQFLKRIGMVKNPTPRFSEMVNMGGKKMVEFMLPADSFRRKKKYWLSVLDKIGGREDGRIYKEDANRSIGL